MDGPAGIPGSQSGIETEAPPPGASLFTEPILVVKQKPKLVEWNAEYTILDRHKKRLGAVVESGGSPWRRESGRHKLQVTDTEGWVVLALETRPTNLIFPTMTVNDSRGARIGQIRLKTFGIVAGAWLTLEVDGRELGAIRVKKDLDLSYALSLEATVMDEAKVEVGRITKTPTGRLKEWLTNADNYFVELEAVQSVVLRSLLIAAPVFIDLVFVQESGRATHQRTKPGWGSGAE